MSLILITGSAGSGKTTIRAELQKRGCEAYDTDSDGFSSWHNKGTGQAVKSPPTNRLPQEWYEQHDWVLSATKVSKLAEQATNKTIFLCGTVGNKREILDLFSQIILLNIDEETLKTRLAHRNGGNEFGKQQHELVRILDWHKTVEKDYRELGAVIIDATRPIETVVENIIEIAGERFRLLQYQQRFSNHRQLGYYSQYGVSPI